MKKLLLIVMCIITGLFMVSCGSSSDSDNESSKITKQDMNEANKNAKLVFTTANNTLADLLADGTDSERLNAMINESCAGYTFVSVSDLKKSENEIDKAIYKALKENDAAYGKLCIEVDEFYNVTFAQWTENESFIGQYPDPETDKNAVHKLGEKFEREGKL